MTNMTRQQFVDALRAKAAGRYIDLVAMQGVLPATIQNSEIGSMYIAANYKRQVTAKWFKRWRNQATHFIELVDLGRGTPSQVDDIVFTCNRTYPGEPYNRTECDSEFCNWALSQLKWTTTAPRYMNKLEILNELKAIANGGVIDVGAILPSNDEFVWYAWGLYIVYRGEISTGKWIHIRIHNLDVRNLPEINDIELTGNGWGHDTKYDEGIILEALNKLPFSAGPTVCTEGDRVILTTCADGSPKDWRECINGVWVEGHQDCNEGCTSGEVRNVEYCSDGSTIKYKEVCDNEGVWQSYYGTCPEEEEGENGKGLLYPIFDFVENILGVDRKTAEMFTYLGIVGVVVVTLGAMFSKK
jgi:hypothetical protein